MSMEKPKCPECGSEDYTVWEEGDQVHCKCEGCGVHLILHLEGLNYENKVEEISEEDREFVRDELSFTAEWLRERYPLTVPEVRRFVQEMVSVSV